MLKNESDLKRLCIENAIEEFNCFLNPYTGWIHYCFENSKESATVPLFENLCYVIALLRSHSLENLSKVNIHLKKVLGFQLDNGAFTKYIHQYPNLEKPKFVIHFCLPFLIINQHYMKVLEPEVKLLFTHSIQKLSSFLQTIPQENLSFSLSFQLAVFQFLFLKKPINNNLIDQFQLSSSIELTSILLVSSMLIDTECSAFAEQIQNKCFAFINWDKQAYIGPLWDEKYRQSSLDHPLLDIMLFHKQVLNHPALMHAPLITHLLERPKGAQTHKFTAAYDIAYTNQKIHQTLWTVANQLSFKSDRYTPKGFHLVRGLYDSQTSLILEPGKFDFKAGLDQNSLSLTFTFQEPMPENVSNRDEINFYVSMHQAVSLLINEKRASVFYDEDTCTIQIGEDVYTIDWFIEEGSGTFLGHIALGHRPNSVQPNEQIPSDYRLSIRTISRTDYLKLKVMFTLMTADKESQQPHPLSEDHCLHTAQSL